MQAKSCAMETLGHEIGHNFGLANNGDAMDTGLGWTIMSFYKGSHINYYSNLNTLYKVRIICMYSMFNKTLPFNAEAVN